MLLRFLGCFLGVFGQKWLKNGFLIGKTQTLNFSATFNRQILKKLNNMSSAVFKKNTL